MKASEIESIVKLITEQVLKALTDRATPSGSRSGCSPDGCPCRTPEGSQPEPVCESVWFDGRLLTEEGFAALSGNGCREIRTHPRTLVTPLAIDRARALGIRLVKEENPPTPPVIHDLNSCADSDKVVFLGGRLGLTEERLVRTAAEAGGFELEVCASVEPGEDFLGAATDCLRLVAKGDCRRAVLIHESIYPVLRQAQRMKGVRAQVCWEPRTALEGRRNDDINVLLLSGRMLGLTVKKRILEAWFST